MTNRPLTDLPEKEFQSFVLENLYESIAPHGTLRPVTEGKKKFKLGTFEFDFIVGNNTGGLTIVEFKVNAHHGIFGQLLLYPRAVQLALPRPVPISVVLISPYLDKGVVDLMAMVRPAEGWTFRALLATGTESKPMLMDPATVAVGEEYFDRAEHRRTDQQTDLLAKLLVRPG